MTKAIKSDEQLLRADLDVARSVHRPAWLGAVLRGLFVLALVALALAAPQLTESTSMLNLLFMIFLNIALSQSWNILAGLAGQVSLGHAAFFGTGALVARVLWTNGWPLAGALAVGGIVPALVAVAVGLPTFRLRGVYFAIGTLAMAEALRITIANVFPLISTLPAESIAAYQLADRYYLALAVALATMLAAYLLLRSRFSLGLLAVREDEEAAQASGVRPVVHKLMASALSSLFAGLAGATFAFYQVSYYPHAAYSPSWTFDALLMTYVGGIGTLAGPVLGAVFFVVAREQLAVKLVNLHPIIFGVVFIIVVLALPGGLMDLWSRLQRGVMRLGKKKVNHGRS